MAIALAVSGWQNWANQNQDQHFTDSHWGVHPKSNGSTNYSQDRKHVKTLWSTRNVFCIYIFRSIHMRFILVLLPIRHIFQKSTFSHRIGQFYPTNHGGLWWIWPQTWGSRRLVGIGGLGRELGHFGGSLASSKYIQVIPPWLSIEPHGAMGMPHD